MLEASIFQSENYIWTQATGSVLGFGTFGKVHKGHRKGTGEFVAIKVLKRPNDDEGTDMYKRNWEMVRAMQNDYIVQYEATEEFVNPQKNKVYQILVMELADGTVRSELQKPAHYFGLPFQSLFTVIDHCVQASYYLHLNNIMHGDIKPDNVLMFTKPRLTFKLCDFGEARFFGPNERTIETGGTYAYLHSAAVNNLDPSMPTRDYTTHEKDMWASSVCFFECATGRVPFIAAKSQGNLNRLLELREESEEGPVVCGERIREPGSKKYQNVYHYEMPLQHYSYSRSLKKVLTQFFKLLFAKDKSYLVFDRFYQLCQALIALKSFKYYNVSEVSIDAYFDTTQSEQFTRRTFYEEIMGENWPQDQTVQIMQGINTYSDRNTRLYQPSNEESLDQLVVWISKCPFTMVTSQPHFQDLMSPLEEADLNNTKDVKNAVGKMVQMQMHYRQMRTFHNTILRFCHTCKETVQLLCANDPVAQAALLEILAQLSPAEIGEYNDQQMEVPEGLAGYNDMDTDSMSIDPESFEDMQVTYHTLVGGTSISSLQRSSLRTQEAINAQEELSDDMGERREFFRTSCKLIAREYAEAQRQLMEATEFVRTSLADSLKTEILALHKVLTRIREQREAQLNNAGPNLQA